MNPYEKGMPIPEQYVHPEQMPISVPSGFAPGERPPHPFEKPGAN